MYIATLVLLFIVVASLLPRCARIRRSKYPLSINYHFTRQCNKTCGFCFHTASTSHIESIENAKHGLSLLKEAGMRKINFAGGEPFLYRKFLGEAVDFCKEVLCLESVSIVTNGSLVKEKFLVKHGHNIDILAISCDSFNEATNLEIGRGSGDQVERLYRIRDLCRKYGIKFKINTVVCRLNFQEDMNKYIEDLAPFRWKCFQVLLVTGENDSTQTKRDARKFLITDKEFNLFCVLHRQQKSFVPESNTLMAKSYLILDEYMRFLDRDGRQPSAPILKVGVQRALDSVYWDEKSFVSRGGIYDWKRDQVACSGIHRDIEW